MNILLSYLEVDTLEAMEYDLALGLSNEIDLHPKRAHRNARRPNAIWKRIALVKEELERRKRQSANRWVTAILQKVDAKIAAEETDA